LSVKNAMERTTQRRSAEGFIVPNFYKSRSCGTGEKKAAAKILATATSDRAAELRDAIETRLDGLEIGRVAEADGSVARLSCPSPATPR
jgi:hypothetical protein